MKWQKTTKILLCFLAGCSPPRATAVGAATAAGDGYHRRFADAHAWSKTFDDPARDASQKPEDVLDALALRSEARVADIGAGTGYFAARIAKRVPAGRVYATDVEPDMVRFLGDRARKEGLANLVAVQSSPDDARLPEPVDVIPRGARDNAWLGMREC